MITELARLSPERLGVIARPSAMQFKSTTKNIAQIGSDLGVSHVLEGSVRRAGERVRITAQLIRVSDESHLWAQSYERGLHDVLEVQAEVARAVAREIQIKLTPHERRRLGGDKTRPINSQAYELYFGATISITATLLLRFIPTSRPLFTDDQPGRAKAPISWSSSNMDSSTQCSASFPSLRP